jgi:rod shape-determining protein MreD
VRLLLAVLVPLVAAVLQGAVPAVLPIAGAFPTLPVLAAASWSVATGAREGLWWAFIGGLATDMLSGGPLGAYTVAALPGALLVGLGERPLSKPIPVLTGAAAVAFAAFLTQLLYIAVLAFLGHPAAPLPVLIPQTVGVGIYTGALALAAYPLARSGRRLTEKESPF